MEITFTQVDQIRKQYSLALQNFLMAFQADSRPKLMEMVLSAADKVAATDNWYIATDAVLRTGIWNDIRSDLKLHATLIKFERMALALLTMDGTRDAFVAGIQNMLLTGNLNDKVVDKDFIETVQRGQEAMQVEKIPGAIGLLSVILYRDIWTIVSK
jgi:hypothetical protein